MLEGWIVGLHLVTAHAGAAIPMESVTPGIYAKAPNGWAGGAYRNSLGRPSAWLGHVFETDNKRWALTVGAVSGYEKLEGQRYCRPGHTHTATNTCYVGSRAALQPLLAPSLQMPLNDGASLRLTYLAGVGKHAHGLHLSLEF